MLVGHHGISRRQFCIQGQRSVAVRKCYKDSPGRIGRFATSSGGYDFGGNHLVVPIRGEHSDFNSIHVLSLVTEIKPCCF